MNTARKFGIGAALVAGVGVALAPLLIHRGALPVRGWILTGNRAQVGVLASFAKTVAGRVPCPEQPFPDAGLTYADGCPTHFGDQWNTLAPPDKWVRGVTRPHACAPGLYALPLSGAERNALDAAQARCTALGVNAPPKCTPILALPALVGDAARNAACLAARDGGVEFSCDGGECVVPDDFADDDGGL